MVGGLVCIVGRYWIEDGLPSTLKCFKLVCDALSHSLSHRRGVDKVLDSQDSVQNHHANRFHPPVL